MRRARQACFAGQLIHHNIVCVHKPCGNIGAAKVYTNPICFSFQPLHCCCNRLFLMLFFSVCTSVFMLAFTHQLLRKSIVQKVHNMLYPAQMIDGMPVRIHGNPAPARLQARASSFIFPLAARAHVHRVCIQLHHFAVLRKNMRQGLIIVGSGSSLNGLSYPPMGFPQYSSTAGQNPSENNWPVPACPEWMEAITQSGWMRSNFAG